MSFVLNWAEIGVVPELCASLSENVEIGPIWPLVTTNDLSFDVWPDLKKRGSFVMIFDAPSNAAYHVSLRGPGAEIEGVLNNPPACGGKSRGPAGCGLTRAGLGSPTERAGLEGGKYYPPC